MREHDRHRHELLGLVRRVAEHHPLVARADEVERIGVAVLRLVRLVDALRDVGRLPVDRDDDAAGLEVEAVLGARVADLGDRLADDRANVDVGLGRDLAGDDDEAGGDQRLAGDAAVGVVGEDRVEDGVRDLIGDLVRMALGDRLRREENERAATAGTLADREEGTDLDVASARSVAPDEGLEGIEVLPDVAEAPLAGAQRAPRRGSISSWRSR